MNIIQKARRSFRPQKKQKEKLNMPIMVATISVVIAACALIISYISLSIQDRSYEIQKNTALSAYLQAYVHLNPVIDVIPGRVTNFNREKNYIEWKYNIINSGNMDVTGTQNGIKFILLRIMNFYILTNIKLIWLVILWLGLLVELVIMLTDLIFRNSEFCVLKMNGKRLLIPNILKIYLI